jgi:hypothetical protein
MPATGIDEQMSWQIGFYPCGRTDRLAQSPLKKEKIAMMKYWFAWAVIALFVMSTQAEEKEANKPQNNRLVAMDTDLDGKISLPEFIAAGQAKATKLEQEFDAEQAKARFQKKDKDADGFLTQAELEGKDSKKKQPKIDEEDSDEDSDEDAE